MSRRFFRKYENKEIRNDVKKVFCSDGFTICDFARRCDGGFAYLARDEQRGGSERAYPPRLRRDAHGYRRPYGRMRERSLDCVGRNYRNNVRRKQSRLRLSDGRRTVGVA